MRTAAQGLVVDINADVGEGCPWDGELLARVSSASIACGAHAGDPDIMLRTLRQAKALGVRVGAHPSFRDPAHFGRRELNWEPDSLRAELLFQVGGLMKLADDVGLRVAYLKAHGALYNQACRDPALARLVVDVAKRCALAVLGLPQSALEQAALQSGRAFIREGFLDRRYRPDGSLVPRGDPDAFLTDPVVALTQARRLMDEGKVESLCIHGDGPNPIGFLDAIAARLGPSESGACSTLATGSLP